MFYISISNGLLKDGHRKRMGEAVWEYMYLIDKITKIDSGGFGWVLGGKPLKLKELADNLCVHRNTVSRNLKILEQEGYIVIIHAPYGLSIRVVKAKKRFTKNGEPDTQRMVNLHTKDGEPNKTVQRQGSNTLPAVAGLSPKKKKEMKTYNEDKHYEESAIDIETGETVIPPKKEKVRKPNLMFELISWAEKRKGSKFVNFGKQTKYIAMMTDAGKTHDEIADRWEEMEKEPFWKKEGFDFKNVCDNFDKK